MRHLLHLPRPTLSAYALHVIFDLHCACVLENECPFGVFALAEGVFKADEHDMRPAGPELDCLVWLDVYGFEFAHF